MRYLYHVAGMCLFLLFTLSLQSQTQYIGPANGDWFSPANWNNGLPAAGNDALIGGGVSVNIGSPLTVSFTVSNFGVLTVKAAITVTAGSNFNNFNSMEVSSSGSIANKGIFSSYGSMTFAGAAGFSNEEGSSFSNNGTFTLQTTLVNKGVISNNGTIDALNGTLQQEGTFDNNQTLTTKSLTVTSTFNNNFGAILNITGSAPVLIVNGDFSNAGTVNNAGLCTINGTFTNISNFNNQTNAVLTINAGAQFNHTGGVVENDGIVQMYGTYTNSYQILNRGEWNSFGQFNNNNLFDNRAGANFTLRPNSQMSMGYGSKILNAGAFDNKATINTFGAIENNGTFTNSGNITTHSGAQVTNTANFTNTGSLNSSDQVSNEGTFINKGKVTVNSGSHWLNKASFTNDIGATVTVIQDFQNQAGATLSNYGTFKNTIRTLNEGSFINNAYLLNTGDFTNETGATLTNNELFHQQAGNIRNKGTLVNYKKMFSDNCSSISNAGGLIDNTAGAIEIWGILFQRGTIIGDGLDLNEGYIHTDESSEAPDLCQDGTFSANIDGDVKVYTNALMAFPGFDTCANMVYLGNGIGRNVYNCSDVGSVIDVNVVLYTRMNDSLTCLAKVTAVDILAPEFEDCPQNVVIFTPDATATATWSVPTALDNCTATNLTSTHNPGATFSVGITSVTYTATDAYDNENFCQFLVDVRQIAPGGNCNDDSKGPTFTNCPPNQNVQATSNMTPVTWLAPTPNDNCKPIAMVASHVPGQGFPIGATTVVYTATDGKNNSSSCSFTVTVTAENRCLNDTQNPVITSCPANIFVSLNSAINGAVAIWNQPKVSDNCGVVSFSSNYASGSIFPAGSTTVTYTAKDAANNTSTCNFTVTVGSDPCPGDISAPVISGCPADINILTTGTSSTATWTAPSATDSCTPITVNNNYSPGAAFPTGATQVRYQFSDKKGNTSECTFKVTVQNACSIDNVAPVISGCPSDITISGGAQGSGTATWTPPTAADNCGLAVFTSQYLPGATFPEGVTQVVYTAIDLRGNLSSCGFNVSVVGAPDCTNNSSPINNTTDVDPAGATLSWETASGASGYDVYLGITNPPATLVASNVNGTSTTISNLQSGQTYYWYVVPKNAAGSASNCGATKTTSFSTATPEAGCNRNVLFVTGATKLSASDATIKAKLESWGFTVSVKKDSDSKASDANDKGLIIISGTVNSTYVNTKFTNSTAPIINYKAALYDDLKMTNTVNGIHYGIAYFVTQTVMKTTNHPLAAGLSGTVPLFSSYQTASWGVPSSSAIKVGHLQGYSSYFMLFGYEAGSDMFGLKAPARRVGFFLEDINAVSMNTKAWKLFEAAVFWASDCESCSSTPPKAVCKDITLQLDKIGQSVQINGQSLDNGSTPGGCPGTTMTLNASPTSFSQPGTYTATLTVTNSQGLSSKCTSKVTVLAPSSCNTPPIAICKDITLQLTKIGQSIQINGQSIDGGSTPGGCAGTTMTLNASPTSFSQPGTYNATLTVTNSIGLSATCISKVTVLAPSSCNNVVSGGSIAKTCINGQVNLISTKEASGGSGNLEYKWYSSTKNCTQNMAAVSGENGASLVVGSVSETTYFVRYAKRSGCSDWVANSNCVTVEPNECAYDPNKCYRIVAKHSGKVLRLKNGSYDNGDPVQQGAWNEGIQHNRWNLVTLNNGYFKIVNVQTGKVLDVTGSSTANGAKVIQWGSNGGNNQQWKLVSLGNGEFSIEARHSGKVLDVEGAGTGEGAQVLQWTWHGGDNQRFYLEEVACSSCNTDVLFVVGSTKLCNGDNWVKSRLQSLGYSVTVKTGSSVKAADANGMGLIVVSSSVNAADVNSKFTKVAVPLMTWESALLGYLKMTGSLNGFCYSETVSNTVMINKPSHPLAAGLSGNVKVYSSVNLMHWGATNNSNAEMVGRIAGDAFGVFGYESGATMQGGFKAPARRVSFFLSDNTATLLTTNGIKLFDAAIAWAAQCNSGPMFGGDNVDNRSVENDENLITVPAEVTVYPNPARDKVFVNLPAYNGSEVLIRLIDASGTVRQQWEVNANTEGNELSLPSHAPGYYLLWIMPSNTTQPIVKKLVLERN